jgi:hypothetical protein
MPKYHQRRKYCARAYWESLKRKWDNQTSNDIKLLADILPTVIQTTPFFSRSNKMPSMRRIKVFGLFILLVVITVLFWTASLRQQRELDSRTVGDFYEKTVNGLNKKPSAGGSTRDSEDEELAKAMTERLNKAEQVAKDNTNAKAPKPDPPSIVVGVGSAAEGSGEKGVAGRKKFGTGETQEPVKEETEEDHEVKVELNSILKKSPSRCLPSQYLTFSRTLAQRIALFWKSDTFWDFRLTWRHHSNHLFEILLPLLKESEKHSTQQVHHRSCAIRGGTGSAPSRVTVAIKTC